ncbi:MAG TPA: hypothetical protein PLZ36_18750, partial [Armatimonadota bacterium]|nr:hypothetical protein [Armatimonadota bacterium]
MKRRTPFFWLATGLGVGLLGGLLLSTAFSAMPEIDYGQVLAMAGETPLTRKELAERTLFKYGSRELDDELRRELIYKEAARRAGIVVADAEVEKRLNDYKLLMAQYADLPAMMGVTFDADALPRWLLADQFRTTLCAEKVYNVSVTQADIDKMYGDRLFMNGFTKPAMAKLTMCIARNKNDATVMWNRLRAGEEPGKVSAQSSYVESIRKVRGDLGLVARDAMSPDVAAAIFDVRGGKGLKPGEFTPVLTYNNPRTDAATGRMYNVTDYIVMYVHDIVPAKVVPKQEVLPVLDMLVRLNKVALAETERVPPLTGKTRFRLLEEQIPFKRVRDVSNLNGTLEAVSLPEW